MISRLRLVGVGAVCLAMVAVVPGVLADPPVPAGQRSPSAAVPETAALVQDEAFPAAPLNPYVPPACTGVFSDVACPGGFAVNWVEQFYADQITAGCGTNPLRYCPDSPVKRSEMAVFVEKAMRGTLNWSPGDLGGNNTGLGSGALFDNSNAYALHNTAIGHNALTTQSYANGNVSYWALNTAVGDSALFYNQPDGGNGALNGTANTAIGGATLLANSTGYQNSAVGAWALSDSQTGIRNTAIGYKAGARGGEVVIGYTGSNVTLATTVGGSYNTFLGMAGSTVEVSNCTAVGQDAYCDNSNEVRLGNYWVYSIGGKVGWSALSDARAKTDIADLNLGLDFVLALRPVSYQLKGGNGRTDMGFVAQDIETLLGDDYNVLGIGGDAERTLSLRHTDLIAPMVKAIQEQQCTIERQQAQIESRDARIGALEARLAAIEERLAGK